MSKTIAPVSPGEMLQEEFLVPLGISKYRLAEQIDMPSTHRRYHFGQAQNYGGYGFAPVPLLWIVRWLVAAAAGELRHDDCEEENGGEVGENCAAGECGMTRKMAALPPRDSNYQCLVAVYACGC